MTQGHPFAPTNYPTQYHDLENGQDEDLSPSDGYFGSNNSIPDTVLIPNPSVSSSKAQEAATESSSDGPQSPLETRYIAYTPATTYTPATSSRGSQSAYDGSVSGYRNSEQALSERSPLLEEPPPLYDDAVAQAAGSNGLTGRDNPVSSPHSGYNSMQVREPVSSLSNSVSAGSGVPQSMSVGVDNCSRKAHDEESDPARPRRSRCRGCCGRKKDRKKRHSRFRRFLALLLGTVLAIWLISDLAKIAIHFYRNSSTHHFPSNEPVPPPPSDSIPRREYRQRESSHSISGTYALYDLLDLQTLSGSISIVVVPHSGHLPAVLHLATTSGSINVKVDDSYLGAARNAEYPDALNRTFDTKISSFSGSIGGDILLGGGGQTTVTSRSGSLNLKVYPVNVDHDSPESTLSTSAISGSSNIKVQDPAWGGKLTQLVAHHHSMGSGSMSIRYPSTWEGLIHAKSIGSGSVDVTGQGLQFERAWSRDVIAWRGAETSRRKMIDVTTIGSGSINFRCQ